MPMTGRPSAAGGSGGAVAAPVSACSGVSAACACCPSRAARRAASSCAKSLARWALAREIWASRERSSCAPTGGVAGRPSRSLRRYASSWLRSRARSAWSSAACAGGSHGKPCSLRSGLSEGGESLGVWSSAVVPCPVPSGAVCAACETHVSTSRSAFGGGGPVELAAGQEGVCAGTACSSMRDRSRSVGEGGNGP